MSRLKAPAGNSGRFNLSAQKPRPDIKTRLELAQRQAQQNKPPQATLELTPAGHRVIAARQEAMEQNNQRIGEIQNSLNRADHKLQSNLKKSKAQGFAKANFTKAKDQGWER